MLIKKYILTIKIIFLINALKNIEQYDANKRIHIIVAKNYQP